MSDAPDLVGFEIAEVRSDALVVKVPWPRDFPFGEDPKKQIAICARRWLVRLVEGAVSVEEIRS